MSTLNDVPMKETEYDFPQELLNMAEVDRAEREASQPKYNEDLAKVTARALIAEGNARKQADTAEATAREQADTALETKITEETSNGAISTTDIADSAVTKDKLADDSVSTDKIVDEAVTFKKLKYVPIFVLEQKSNELILRDSTNSNIFSLGSFVYSQVMKVEYNKSSRSYSISSIIGDGVLIIPYNNVTVNAPSQGHLFITDILAAYTTDLYLESATTSYTLLDDYLYYLNYESTQLN